MKRRSSAARARTLTSPGTGWETRVGVPQVMERGWVSKAPRLRHVAPFDGIRGFGVVGVMAGHALPFATLSFSAIVDVLFVISGLPDHDAVSNT